MTAVIAIFAPTFRRWAAFANVLENSSVLFIMGTGMTIALIAGCLDLSVGSIYALVSVVTGQLLINNVPVPAAILVGLGAGILCGVINGLTVTRTGVPTLIATLGTTLAFRGLANMLGAGKDMSRFPASFDILGSGTWGPVVNCAIAFAMIWFIFKLTMDAPRIAARARPKFLRLVAPEAIAIQKRGDDFIALE